MPKQPSPIARTLSSALLVAVVASGACGLFVVSGPRDELNLMVITLDTFRADRLGAYGSRRGLTPHLDRFAEEGVLFETTQSVAPLTLPAHSSLFTGASLRDTVFTTTPTCSATGAAETPLPKCSLVRGFERARSLRQPSSTHREG